MSLNHVTPSERYYGFVSSPFSLTPDLRFAYDSRSYIAAWEQVKDALRHREGLIVITGEIGTGKTMLCRALLEGLGQARTFLSVILDPCLTVDDLMYQVLTDFGISSSSARPTSGPAAEATRHQLVATLQQFLASLIPIRAHAVVMIDEAQHLDPTVLEQLRLLSNFETDDVKLLQIVLVGQPDLDALLARPDMRQLNQRVARRIQLEALSGHEVSDYVARRLSVASGDSDTRLEVTAPFTTDAIAAVQQISRGVPRVINILCDRALEIGHAEQATSIGRAGIVDRGQETQAVLAADDATAPEGAGSGGCRGAARDCRTRELVVVRSGHSPDARTAGPDTNLSSATAGADDGAERVDGGRVDTETDRDRWHGGSRGSGSRERAWRQFQKRHLQHRGRRLPHLEARERCRQ